MTTRDPQYCRLFALEQARERMNIILATNRWPSGMSLSHHERELLIENARRQGIVLNEKEGVRLIESESR
jgi:DNA-binding transcriptional MocR family regulator